MSAVREFINEVDEKIVITVGNDGIGTGAIVVFMDSPHSRGEWTITAREASELWGALGEHLAESGVSTATALPANGAKP